MSDYNNILVAIDMFEGAEQVIRKAMELAKPAQAKVHLLHVVEYLPPIGIGDDTLPSPGWMIDEDELVNTAAKRLKAWVDEHAFQVSSQEVLAGIAKHDIVRSAQQRGADLIVIGSHGRHGIRHLLGATADAVLHHASCDVLAVRIGSDG